MLERVITDFEDVEADLAEIGPVGYTIALNVRYITPEFYRSTFPESWVNAYTEGRYVIADPVALWASLNSGRTRWSEIEVPLIGGLAKKVMTFASSHDLKFGAAAALRDERGRKAKSLLSVARNDRELTDAELDRLEAILRQIIEGVGGNAGLTGVEIQTLRDLAEGFTHQEIAEMREVSPATVKKRIERAREMLGAKNAVQAVAIATKRGLIIEKMAI